MLCEMILDAYIQKMIQEKVECDLMRPAQFEALSEDVYQVTGERLGVNTLKRLFGMLPDVSTTGTTLNIIAQYLGYGSWSVLNKTVAGMNSSFNEAALAFYPKDCEVGTELHVNYAPDREVQLKVISDNCCEVLSANAGKLRAGDMLDIPSIMIGSPFVVRDVVRDGKSLGNYVGGIEGGVTRVFEEPEGLKNHRELED
jgi:hypothetical protein